MSDYTTELKGDKLILTIDVSDAAKKAAQPSSTGKTLSVASSGGFTIKQGGVSVSFNATMPNPAHTK